VKREDYYLHLPEEDPVAKANEKQVGGTHYKKEGGEEHWDRVWRLYGRGYFIGCITKYLERYPEKNGIQDLQKAKHFLDKLIELEAERGDLDAEPTAAYVNQDQNGRC
jgi:hypothetical protein